MCNVNRKYLIISDAYTKAYGLKKRNFSIFNFILSKWQKKVKRRGDI